MSFIKLFNLYCSFMEGNELHHSDLVTPITEYAKAEGKSASAVLANIQSMYQRV